MIWERRLWIRLKDIRFTHAARVWPENYRGNPELQIMHMWQYRWQDIKQIPRVYKATKLTNVSRWHCH